MLLHGDVSINYNVTNSFKVFPTLNFTVLDAVRIFFTRICEERGIPFDLKLPQEYEHWTSQAITDTEEDIRAGRISKPFKNVEDMMSALDAD